MKKLYLVIAFFFCLVQIGYAQTAYNTAGATYSQSFDALPNTTGTSATWTNNSTLAGWYAIYNSASPTAATAIVGQAGAGTTGLLASFGANSNSNRSLGYVYANSLGAAGTYSSFGVGFTNGTGGTLDNFTLAYLGRQWRTNTTTPGSLTVEYKIGGSFDNTNTGWTAIPALTFTGPNLTGATNVDGYLTGNTASLSTTINSISWTNGSVIWFRWRDLNDAGTDAQLAIDDVSFSSAVSGPSAPTLTTPTAASITTTTATLGATVTSNGGAALSSRGTVWGTAAAPTTNLLAEGGTAVNAFTHARTGFSANTLYYYRGYAINASGTGYSPDGTFTTLPDAPAGTPTASGIASNAFQANWAIVGGTASYGYEVQVSTDNTFATGVLTFNVAQSANPAELVACTGLSAGTTYYFRVRAVNAGGNSAWSSTSTAFNTLTTSPTVTTTIASAYTSTTVTAGGNLTSTGGNVINDRGVVFNTTVAPTMPTGISFSVGSGGTGVFSGTVLGLAPQTQYYYRAYVFTTAWYYGAQQNLFTLSAPPTDVAANLVATATASNQVDLTWDVATWPATGVTNKGYILLRAVAPTVPALTNGNGVLPTAAGGTTIVSSTVAFGTNNFSNTGLSQLTTYNYALIPYSWNGANPGTYNYSTPIYASAATPIGPCVAPTTAPTAPVVGTPTLSTIPFSWTPSSTGGNSLVIVRQGAPVSVAPASGNNYTASSMFTVGDNLGSGNYVCYNGTGNSFTLTNLSAATTYYFAVYTFNTSGYCFYTAGSATANGTTALPSSIIETFEPATKGGYTVGTTTGVLGVWTFDDALVGTAAGSDRFNGTRSARIQGTGSITSEFDKVDGLGLVQVKHALFGTDVSTTWRLDVSDDGGATFTAYQSPVITTSSTTLTTQNFTVNLTGDNIRIRISKLSGSNSSRLNIDDISMADYVSTNTIATGAIATTTYCVTNSTGSSITVPFTAVGTYNAGNVYTVQLSDGSGSFALPIDIGTLNSTANSGNIVAAIPAATATGSGYRVRVISSDPPVTGTMTATALTINLNTPDVTNLNAGTSSGSVALGWTAPTGCFTEYLVLASTSAVTCLPSGDGSAYTANSVFGSGTNCSGAFVVYKGSGTSANITGLTNGVTYHFEVFVRNGTVWSTGVSVTAVPNDFIVGDYRSRVGTHNYSTDINAWQVYAGGGVWNNVTTFPNGASINVFIVNGSIIELSSSMANNPIRNLTVEAGGIIRGSSTTNTYLSVYGDIVCNGTIGNGSTWNSISFNIEGANCTISGSAAGAFDASRIRKNSATNATTELIIAKSMNLRWNSSSGTAIYNNAANATFNVTVNNNTTCSIIIDPAAPVGASGNICIDGVNGIDLAEKGGTFTINGTLNVPGILYATTNNTSLTYPCTWVIGATGVVNCNQVNCNASGVATHTLRILNGGKLNINTNVGFSPTNFSPTNNVYDLQAGSTVEYSATSGVTSMITDLTYSNLLLSGSGTRDLINSALSTTGLTLTVNKNLTISGSATLDASSNSVEVGGNWLNYGSLGFAEGTSVVNFNGFSGYQTITCPGGEVFYNMSVSNNTVNGVEMNADVEVLNDLTLGAVGRLFFGPTPSILRLSKMSPGSNSLIGTPGSLLDMSGSASTLFVGCQNLNYTGSFNAGSSSLVNYNRNALVASSGGSGVQSVTTGFVYANLSFSGSNAKNTDDNFTVNGTLTVDGSTTSLEALTAGRTLTIGGDIILSGGGTMGGATGASCLSNLSIVTAGDAAQTFNAGFESINCYNLTTNKNANGITLNAGNTTMAVSNILTQSNAATLTPNDNRVKIGGAWSIWGPAAFNKGTSTIEYNGSAAETVIAVNYYNLESSSTGGRTMANSGTIGIENAFTPGTNIYNFSGSTVDYNGALAQNIAAFTAMGTTTRTYNNLTLSNAGTKSLVGNTDVEGALSINNTITLALGNQYLNLKSTATQTARVAPVSAAASITYGTGRFVVERYYPGRRSWRLLTAPVTIDANQSFYRAWQVGGTSPAGVGTYITGPSPAPATNGLDVSPQNNSSLKTFNQLTSGFDAVTNTRTALIAGTAGVAGTPDSKGYFMFVRGDRTPSNVNAFTPLAIVNETTLTDTGKIMTQAYTFAANPSTGTHKYTLIGNPYASPVDFAALTRNNVANKFQAWDPGLNVVGGYATVDLSSGAAVVVPVGSTQTQIIQSSQAFVIETSGASSPSISFNEANKSSVNNLSLFRPVRSNTSSLAVNLYLDEANDAPKLADGVLVQFGGQYEDMIDQFDQAKFTNINENFNLWSNNTGLILERRKPVKQTDTIFFRMGRMTNRAYKLKVMADQVGRNNLQAYLEDSYLKTSTPVSLNGETWVDFAVNADAASKATGRFYLVFKKVVQFTKINAIADNGDGVVSWEVGAEKATLNYEVQRSVDEEVFEAVGKVMPKANNGTDASYTFVDRKPTPGVYYYRIASKGMDGELTYSDAVKVTLNKGGSPVYVFPNPVKAGKMQLQFNALAAGTYGVKLLSNAGQVVYTGNISHAGGTATHRVDVSSLQLKSGVYHAEIQPANGKSFSIKVVLAD